MADILEEIKEDIKQERLAKLWKQYGTFIIILAIAIIMGTAGKVWWQNQKNAKEQALAMEYYQVLRLLEQGKFEEAKPALDKMVAGDSAAYTAFAGFTKAQQYLAKGNVDEALVSYREVVNNEKANFALRDLAKLLLVYYRIEHRKGNEKAIAEDIASLMEAGNPWYYSAMELKAVWALQKKDNKTSYELFKQLSTDHQAPVEMQRISKEVVEALASQYPHLAEEGEQLPEADNTAEEDDDA